MTIRIPQLAIAVAVMATVIVFSVPAAADQWDSIPELEPRDHLAVARGLDGPRYNSLRACYRNLNSLAGVEFYGALVSVTHPDGDRGREHDEAHEYAAHVAEQWAADGRLDPELDVVVVLGATNRSIGVHVGEQWRRWGLDEQIIGDMIEASRFPRQMRRRNYDDAMCILSESIDYRLARFERESERAIVDAKRELPEAEARFDALKNRVEASLPEQNELRSSLINTLTAAQSLFDAGDEVDADPQSAIEAARKVHEVCDDVEKRLDPYLEYIEPLDGLGDQITSLKAGIEERPDSGWRGPTAAEQTLEQCEAKVSQARLSADPNLMEIRDCIAEAQTDLERSDVRHFFLARAIPGGGFLLFVLLGLTYVVARFRRRRRAKDVLAHDLQLWASQLEHGDHKLQALRDEFGWYFSERDQFWQGESADTDRQIADGINRAFLFQSRGADLLNEASSMNRRSKLLNVGKLEKALRLLRGTAVSVEAGDIESDRPLRLPLTKRYEVEASQLLHEFDVAYSTARQGLEQVAPVQEEIAELAAAADEKHDAATAEIEARQHRELPTDFLVQSLDQAVRQWSQAIDLAHSNPEQAAAVLQEAVEALEAVRSRARDGNEVLEAIEGPVAELRATIQQRLEAADREGIDFEDRGFEPRGIDTKVGEQIEEIIELVSAGREQDAEARLAPVLDELESTDLKLSVCLETGDLVPQLLQSLASAAPKIKERLFHVRMRVKKVADDEALAEHVDEIAKLQKIVPRLDRLIPRIESAHEEGKRLASAANLSALVQALASGLESLATLQRLIDDGDEDGPPALPPKPMWQPSGEWEQSCIQVWGSSEEAEDFRSFSLF